MSRINFNDILINPSKTVPNLGQQEIRIIIIEVIIAYLEKKITLRTIAEVAALIKKHNLNLVSIELKNDLDELRSMYVEEEVLNDILVDLASA